MFCLPRDPAAALLLATALSALRPQVLHAQTVPPPTPSQSETQTPEEKTILAEAKRSADQDAPAKAEEAVTVYLHQHPHSADAHFLLGYALFREIQIDGVHPGADAEGVLSMRERRARESLAQYTEGARYHAPGAFDLKIVALDYILLNDYADADKWLSKSIAWDPGDAQSWYYEGRIKFKEAQYKKAVADFTHMLNISPRDVEAEDNLGLTYEAMGQVEAAAAAFKTAIDWDKDIPAPSDGPWLNLGILLTQQQHVEQAVPYLSEAVRRAPGDVRAHEGLASAYRSMERWPEAQAEFEQAVRLAPTSASLHFQLGQAYRRTGHPEQARAEFSASAALEQSGAAPTKTSTPP